jgi:hypothetical protein
MSRHGRLVATSDMGHIDKGKRSPTRVTHTNQVDDNETDIKTPIIKITLKADSGYEWTSTFCHDFGQNVGFFVLPKTRSLQKL